MNPKKRVLLIFLFHFAFALAIFTLVKGRYLDVETVSQKQFFCHLGMMILYAFGSTVASVFFTDLKNELRVRQ